jgi:hypothetical protein
MVSVNKHEYYEKLVDFYYNNIHFDTDYSSIHEWATHDLGADINRFGDTITFANPADATMFILKWNND